MKKLDDIPKKEIFEVPDRYFDQLPMKIQARIESARPAPALPKWSLALRLAIPVVVLVLALGYYLKSPSGNSTEEILASITSENLMAFLDESEVTEVDLLEAANFDDVDADSLNLQVQTHYVLGGVRENELQNELDEEL